MADSEIEDDDESVEYAGEENEDGVSQVWIDSLFDDLETAHYSCGAVVFPACGIGSPHIRLRTWFVAERSFETVGDSIGSGLERHGRFGEVADQEGRQGAERYSSEAGGFDVLDNANGRGCGERELGDEAGSECEASGGGPERREGRGRDDTADAVSGNGMADSEHAERRQECVHGEDGRDRQDSGRQEAYGEPRACGEVLGMVNTEIGGERSYSGESQEGAQSPEPHRGRSVPNGVVDSSNERSERGEGTGWEAQRRTEYTGVSSGVADSTTDGRGEERPISGGLGAGDGTEGWPAGSDARGIAGGLVYADSCGADSLGRSDSQDGEEAPRGARADDSSDLHDGTGPVGGMDDSPSSRHIGPLGGPESNSRNEARLRGLGTGREEIGLADTNGGNAGAEREQRSGQQRFQPQDDLFGGEGHSGIGHNGGPGLQGSNPTDGFWGNPDWLFCRDGKWRPIESGSTALAHGLPRGMGTLSPELRRLAEMAGLDGKSLAGAKKFRIGSLKGYGNAIVSDVAVEIIKAYMEYADDRN